MNSDILLASRVSYSPSKQFGVSNAIILIFSISFSCRKSFSERSYLFSTKYTQNSVIAAEVDYARLLFAESAYVNYFFSKKICKHSLINGKI